jgi:hypothetical protein
VWPELVFSTARRQIEYAHGYTYYMGSLDLLLDIKTIIASFDWHVWVLLYLYDDEFRVYAQSAAGRHRFIESFTVCTIDNDHRTYSIFDEIQRAGGLPARVRNDEATKWWYLHGKLHRDGGLPALTSRNCFEWRRDGLMYRDGDLPAVVSNYVCSWWQGGELHRDNDLPAAIHEDGTLCWCQHGQPHRDGNPAVIRVDGGCEWYVHGKLIS